MIEYSLTRSSTRFIIISDTHGLDIWEEQSLTPPKVDVVLHCGDLSGIGSLHDYKKTIAMLAKIPAELRLVIAGNHDRSLDRKYVEAHTDEEDYENDLEEHKTAWALWTGKHAEEAGVTFLQAGMHEFKLKSGASFTVYASPRTPAFMDWAYMYGNGEDPFNSVDACCPVPSSGVDIMMTHGPPRSHLGMMTDGNDAGCEKLLQAVQRAKPLLHCFGHIHEAHGAETVTWASQKTEKAVIDSFEYDRFLYLDALKLAPGKQTLLVNAAMQEERKKLSRPPWIVNLALPSAQD